MLKYIDNLFNNSSLKVKLELYILPLLLIYLIVFFYSDFTTSPHNIKTYDFNKLENKKYSGLFLELSKEIEGFCNRRKIKLLSIKNSQKSFFIKGETNIKKIYSLINKLEYLNSYTNLVKLNINKKSSNIYNFELHIKMDQFYVKNRRNHLLKKIDKFTNKLNLKAIVSSYVFINKKWLVQDEIINGYKIINIQKNFVELSKNTKKIKLWVYKND
jgi:hypothetical protein